MKPFVLILTMLTGISCSAQQFNEQSTYALKNPNARVMQLDNGLWYNGETFEKKSVWTKDGLLEFEKVREVDTVIDLSGKYVIPPFAEAHNHNLESAYGLEERIKAYLDNGVFYVKLLSSIKKRIDPLMGNYNKPDGIDISLAHAPLTATDGHPIGVRKRYLDKGYFDGMFNSLKEIEFHGYVLINDKEDLENKWDSIMSFAPDFIKLNLLYSEEYKKRRDDTAFFANKGLNPSLIGPIVDKAHSEGLRVSAHVETAYDFHIAVAAGVDEIAHLPEIDHGKLIDVNDAIAAKEKGIVVVTTVSLVTKYKNKPEYQNLVDNCRANLKILKDAGVTLALGSDMYNDNSVNEMKFLDELGVFSSKELLKMWTLNATSTTFPKRKVGRLQEGYEASFLVLDQDPLKDLSKVNETIILRVKQGELLK
ncbi:MAG: amidohydrolase family protein [Bacteroidota bacterium]